MSSIWDPIGIFDESSSSRLSRKLAQEQWDWQQEKWDENFEEQKRINQANYALQVGAYQWQQELNKMQMEREDNAVQRRVADLKEAGLSPTLAAGSAASASPVHAGTAPQAGASLHEVGENPKLKAAMFAEQMQKERMSLALTALGNFADISRTKAEIEMMRAKTGEQDIINKYLDSYLAGRNLGQNLSNDAMRIGNEFAAQLNQAKIDQINKGIEHMDAQIEQNKALAELTRERVVTERAEQIYKGLQQSELSARISDNWLKQMSMAYSLRWYVNHDLPYGSTANNTILLNAVDKATNWLYNGGLFHSYGVTGKDNPLPAELGGINLNNVRDSEGNLKGLKDSVFWPIFEPWIKFVNP